MARSRLGPSGSQVQLRTLNRRAQQKDNSDLLITQSCPDPQPNCKITLPVKAYAQPHAYAQPFIFLCAL